MGSEIKRASIVLAYYSVKLLKSKRELGIGPSKELSRTLLVDIYMLTWKIQLECISENFMNIN